MLKAHAGDEVHVAKKEQPFNNPFGGLKLASPAPSGPPKPTSATTRSVTREPRAVSKDSDEQLFLESVGAVDPVRSRATRVGPREPPPASALRIINDEAESLARLAELVSGAGVFDLSDSDEFIEGSVQGFDVNVMRKLRAGDFSVQAHVDLHGLTKDEAKLELEAFISKSKVAGLRCVLVVTGRGLHSKDQLPVLKEGVQGWLTRGRLAKQVLGFCSARPKDGGAGALYVLLRR